MSFNILSITPRYSFIYRLTYSRLYPCTTPRLWCGDEDIDGGTTNNNHQNHHHIQGQSQGQGALEKDVLWSIQGIWMLLLASTLGDAKLNAVLAHKETDVMTLMSEATTTSTQLQPPTPHHASQHHNHNNSMLSSQEFTELSMQSAIVSIDLWCRLGCPAMAILQCRR